MPVKDNRGNAGGNVMKKTERRLALIQASNLDEPNDRDENGGKVLTAMLLDMGTLNWNTTRALLGGLGMLPRDFEVTLVPGPEELQ